MQKINRTVNDAKQNTQSSERALAVCVIKRNTKTQKLCCLNFESKLKSTTPLEREFTEKNVVRELVLNHTGAC